ncbi:RNA polymerase subunit sigma-70 [Nocardia sp. alder85J]|uniref:RNA polymerase subunit sigma-70 n=1 Tax=Nocardia sp. alder85J TaxID=2862949 RepID=UPI001CD62583|nr:RNA polymerase subunit sigma-70 [Nocardia sp. alder85J]MCX4094947.1 RNA polymerase subunit sigma-70 [Nocardia sp. alder85J]
MSASTGAAPPEPAELEALRIPLTGYCYRLLGCAADTEDAVQETLIRAHLRRHTFDPQRARLSTWLHAIATNICLDLLRARERRMLTWDGPVSAGFDPNSALPADRWVAPMPDAALLAARDPADVVAQRESVRLAFVAALQHLPPRQRAVLVLREVLAFTASETADMLGTGTAAVNSALQRARATLAAVHATPTSALDPADPRDRDLIERYVTAFEAHDVATLATLLCADAESGMPPFAWRLSGREAIVAAFAATDACVGDRLIQVAMNGSIGFGQYRRDTAGVPRPFALLAVAARDGRIAQQITFLGSTDRFAAFGLPPALPK